MYSALARGSFSLRSQALRCFAGRLDGNGGPKQPASRSLSTENSSYVEAMYEIWKKDPKKVHQSWNLEFTRMSHATSTDTTAALSDNGQLGSDFGQASQEGAFMAESTTPDAKNIVLDHMKVQALIRSYQVSGHRIADIDPLGQEPKRTETVIPELLLDAYGFTEKDFDRNFILPETTQIGGEEKSLTLREIVKRLQKTYCGSTGIQYMYMPKRDHAHWIRDRFETPGITAVTVEERKAILQRLVKATWLEEFLAKKWPAEKRFGLEGCESLIPGLQAVIDTSSEMGVASVVIGMAHRGRLNVIANAVNPLVQGKTRAEQFYSGDVEGEKVMSIIVHGDAAFAGQGIVYETFHLSELPDYTTHGTIHIVVNNQVGFTTDPRVARSSPYCTDVARVVNAPIFHVNGDDPEAVHHVCKVAAEWRATFKKDVVIDVVGYRRNGHNEIDEPNFTQPIMYKKIRQKKTVLQQYSDRLIKEGIVEKASLEKDVADYVKSLDEDFQNAGKATHVRLQDWLDSPWPQSFFTERDQNSIRPTGVDMSVLTHVSSVFGAEPKGLTLHRGIKRILEGRRKMAAAHQADWAMGEALAWGSLLQEGVHVRLSGQDVERGTFSHRHHVLHDQEKDKTTYRPLNHLSKTQAPYTVCNSSLSEYGVVGFDLGFSTTNPDALVVWEAQFGDFVNTAQCVVDQFIASGFSKWRNQNGFVLLLPHGMEGMGPEHSSGQLERFLQLSSDNSDEFQSEGSEGSEGSSTFEVEQLRETNWQVVNLTTPSNFFHAMRRQVALPFRRPLVVFTPKSLLKYAEARSNFDEMTVGTEFKRIYPESGRASENPPKVGRVLFCSGKVFYELKKERDEKGLAENIALVRVEQICPFPYDLVKKEMEKYSSAEVVWVQEEHQNRGAWAYVQPRINNLLRLHMKDPRQIKYVGRTASASPATGNKYQHLKEQANVLVAALNVPQTAQKDENSAAVAH